MALIDPKFYTGPALIIGDGNFSFSACLAQSVEKFSSHVYATSLDTDEELQANLLAKENLAKLSQYSSFIVFHAVDATNLQATFKDQTFQKIIFNFPHTGGKLKISKCRNLLEKFFISACKFIDPNTGVVCVSLCQGQGGSPRDHVQRDYGNTWQVVNQAAKAGLILHAVHPFREADYPGYTSAGFKGRLNQGFTADKGLTYMFILGSSIQPVSDLQSFLTMQKDPSNSYKSLYQIHNHPVSMVKRKLENIFSTTSFVKTDVERLGNKLEISLKLTDSPGVSSLYHEVYQAIRGQDGFDLSGIESDFSIPSSAGFHPVSHYVVIGKSYDIQTPTETIHSELEEAVQTITKLCSGLSLTNERPSTLKKDDLNFPKCQLNLFKPVDYQRLRERKRIFLEWRPIEVCSHNSLQESTLKQTCAICELEQNYFSKDTSIRISDMLEESTVNKVYYNDMVMFTYGLVKQDDCECNKAWIVIAHVDNLTMSLCGISDIRMLWSQDMLFLQQYDIQNEETLPTFIPFSLFPPIYIHDISFWLTADSSEEKFFKAIHDVTRNLVSDVWFRERYVDITKNQVSYNYRMVYSRCDGPLTHIQTVEVQNLLRLLLINMNFTLS